MCVLVVCLMYRIIMASQGEPLCERLEVRMFVYVNGLPNVALPAVRMVLGPYRSQHPASGGFLSLPMTTALCAGHENSIGMSGGLLIGIR